jgi:endonuclease/exonuclease/phosphatase family metal-dependent hydrolase
MLVFLLACNGEEPTVPTASVDLVTYNAGLAVGFVPGADSRAPQVAEAVAGLDADVVCLQEVWLPEHVAAIDAAVADTFPHRFAPAASQSSDASCDPGALDSLVSCIEDSCDMTCADAVPDCLFASCGVQFLLLPRDCMRCAMANVGEDPATVASVCEGAPIEYAYGGSFGTMLLSKHPIGPVQEHVFASTSNRRSVLQAEVDVDGKPLTVLCTHLTAVFDDIPYPRDEGSWVGEQLDQIAEIDDLAAGIDGPVVLVGDLNTGPLGDGLQPESPGAYDALMADGWGSPYVELDGRCTFCSDNPLLAPSADDDDNRLIDHVLTRGGATGTAATRILDGTISADSCAVDLSTSALSDHYGVQVTVEF